MMGGSRRLDILERSLQREEINPCEESLLDPVDVPKFDFDNLDMPPIEEEQEVEIPEGTPDALVTLFNFVDAEIPSYKKS